MIHVVGACPVSGCGCAPVTSKARGVHLVVEQGRVEVWVVTSTGALATPPMELPAGVPAAVARRAGQLLLDRVDAPRSLELQRRGRQARHQAQALAARN